MVVTLLGILMAIAAPNLLGARLSAAEGAAIGSLRSVDSGQYAYAAVCGGGFYAPSLVRLATPPIAGGGGFISPGLGNDPAFKSGYAITFTAGVAAGSQVPCNGGAAGSSVLTYFVGADPVDAGNRFFGTNSSQTIYQSPAQVVVTQTGIPTGATPIQ